jgi:DNA-binding MarR family transcriptional regulator
MSESGIILELSEAQVDRVLKEAAEHDGLLPLLAGIEELVEFKPSPAQLEDPRFSRSLLLGLMVFSSFTADGLGRSVTDVAHELGMGISTTHRYVSTLLEVGLLEREPVSREYRLVARG